jgi:hypothetical protein
MRIRTLTLGGAAMAAALVCALPALAQSNHYRGSSDAERAQTESLNAEAANRARQNMAYGDGRAHDNGYDRGGYRNDRGGSMIAIDFGNIAFAYDDGYWDNSRHWHAWRDGNEVRAYRNHRGNHFHRGHHDHQRNNGWMR